MQTRKSARTRRWILAVALASFAVRLHAAEPKSARRPVRVDDLYRFDHPSAPTLAPDGRRLAYSRQWIDEKTRQERCSLWLVTGQTDKARALESGEPDARDPVFSPDGKWIAFRSTRRRPNGWEQTPSVPPESEPATDIWLIRADEGKAVPLAGPEKPYSRLLGDPFYGRIAFSPDGRRLAFVADDGKDPRSKDEIEADVFVVRPDQGEGYTGYGPAQVWVAELSPEPDEHAAVSIRRLTDDDVWYGDPQWSPDGRTIVVHANRTLDRESVRYSINKNFDLWEIEVGSGRIRQLTTGAGPEVSPRFSPDGKRLVCLSVPRKGPHMDVFNLKTVTLEGGRPRCRILFDHHGRDGERPPHPAPSFPLPENCWDDPNTIVYHAAAGTKTRTIRLDLESGRAEPLTEDKGGPQSEFAIRRDRIRRLTPAGNLFLQNRLLGETRVICWDNSEGTEIEGVLTLPPESVARPPFKLVVYPHGGPHSRATEGFNFTAQVFAAHDYAVFQPNFRGSYGYGKKFLDADRNDFGGGDMRDILTGIESLAKKGIVDRERQFVYGVSYGGFMTCWLVGHTNQFRAAVAQNAVTDLNVMWGLSDLQSWTEWEFGGRPWEVPVAMRRHSPISYVDKVCTPTLILHSREDHRCPIAMGRMFHQALLARGVATRMVVYSDEGHGIRQPRHRADVLRRVLAWFNEHDIKPAGQNNNELDRRTSQ